VIPLVYVGISILILLLTYTYTSLRSIYRDYKAQSNTAKFPATADDESFDSDEEGLLDESDSEGENSESTLIDSLPKDTKVSVTEDISPYERVWVVAEVALLTGQVALSIFSIIKREEWRSIVIAGNLQWLYLLIIALLRLWGMQRTRMLWNHSTLIYLCSWPIAFLMLRSAVLIRRKLDLGVQITNICLVTGLCALVLTTRVGNKAVKLVSTNSLEPTRVCPYKIPLNPGTDS
jgi:hypothetical protein